MSLDPTSSAIHLNLPPTSSSQSRAPTLVTVHPSVVAQILTDHSRRCAGVSAPRVIGTLLGSRSESGHEVDVRSCFAVPHTEGEDQVAIDMPFQQSVAELLAKNGVKESVVGWYATHPTLNGYSALIQHYYSSETNPFPAVHLTVDTDLDATGASGLGVKAWVSTALGLNTKAENCVFLPVPVVVKYADSERAALDLVTGGNPTPTPSLPALTSLSSSLTQLSSLIDACLTYVQSVTSGAQAGDAVVGRHLLEGVGRWAATTTAVPAVDGEAVAGETEDEGIREGLQDTLTVSYLSNLVRTQVELAGRLAVLPQAQQ